MSTLENTTGENASRTDADSNLYGDDFTRVFPIRSFTVPTKNNESVGTFTIGDAICNSACIQYMQLLTTVKAIEGFLEACETEKQNHGIGSLMSDTLYDLQDELALLYNNVADRINKLDLER